MNKKKERKIDDLKPSLKRALEEYSPNLLKDKEEFYVLKEQLQKLPEVDRIVFLLYTELQSYAELAKLLGVSKSTCFWQVKRIREELKGILKEKEK